MIKIEHTRTWRRCGWMGMEMLVSCSSSRKESWEEAVRRVRWTSFFAGLVSIASLFNVLPAHAGRQSVILWTTDTQHVHPDEGFVADASKAWIWDRLRDQRLGVPRNDATASGGLPIIAILFGGDVVENVLNATGQWAIWKPWWQQWGGAGPDGYGPIPYLLVDGNHDEANNPLCGSPFSPGIFCDESFHIAEFPPSQYTYPGFIGCSGPIPGSYHLGAADGLNCAARVPSGHDFDVLLLGLSWFGHQALGWAQSILDANPGIPVIVTSHRHAKLVPADHSQCGRSIGEYWTSPPRFMWTNRDVVLWLNGHHRGIDDLGVLQEERPACHIAEDNSHGFQTVTHYRNWQDYVWATNPSDGTQTHFIEVITFDWDLSTINFKVYQPKYGVYNSDAPSAEYTVSNFGFSRFVPTPVPQLSPSGRSILVAALLTLGLLLAARMRWVARGASR